jgi:hypothetical protein
MAIDITHRPILAFLVIRKDGRILFAMGWTDKKTTFKKI